LIASATEFSNVRVRKEEQQELDDLQKECPLPLEGPVHDSVTKVFVLMQAFITRKRPKSFTLVSDINYIASNAGKKHNLLSSCVEDFFSLVCRKSGSCNFRNVFAEESCWVGAQAIASGEEHRQSVLVVPNSASTFRV
jgi:hypothetical protein